MATDSLKMFSKQYVEGRMKISLKSGPSCMKANPRLKF